MILFTEMIQFLHGIIRCFEMIQNDDMLQQSTIKWWSSDLANTEGRYIEVFVEPHAEEAVGFILVCGTRG